VHTLTNWQYRCGLYLFGFHLSYIASSFASVAISIEKTQQLNPIPSCILVVLVKNRNFISCLHCAMTELLFDITSFLIWICCFWLFWGVSWKQKYIWELKKSVYIWVFALPTCVPLVPFRRQTLLWNAVACLYRVFLFLVRNNIYAVLFYAGGKRKLKISKIYLQ
jgi:hypothetical protein